MSTKLEQITPLGPNESCFRSCGYRDHSMVDYEVNQTLRIHVGFAFSSNYPERAFDCEVNLENYAVIGEPHECRDALTVLNERLATLP